MILSYLPLYIDPGTGSMLFSILIGLATTAVFGLRALIIKLKFFGGKSSVAKDDKNHLTYTAFSDSKRYWNVFEPICDEFEKRKIAFYYYTCDKEDPALIKKYEFVKCEYLGEKNKPFSKMNFLNTDICITSTPGLDVYQWKRSKQTPFYAFIPHAIDEMLAYRMFGLDYFDAIFLTGDFQGENIRKLEKLRNLPAKELITVGYPPLDVLKKKKESLPERKKNAVHVILVAPSWGPSGILKRYGRNFLEALSKTEYKIIIRPHPQTAVSEKELLSSLMAEFSNNDKWQWNFDNNNFDCMNESDVLITDFSGIIFEYAFLFEKPIIYADTNFDKSVYDADWIDEPLWRFEILKKIGIKLEGDYDKIIKEALTSKMLRQNIEATSKEAWMYKGESASRIVDFLIQKQKEIASTKQ